MQFLSQAVGGDLATQPFPVQSQARRPKLSLAWTLPLERKSDTPFNRCLAFLRFSEIGEQSSSASASKAPQIWDCEKPSSKE